MDATSYHDIKRALRQLYLNDPRPRLVGFSGGNAVRLSTGLISTPNPFTLPQQ
jgi:hypothetical protein